MRAGDSKLFSLIESLLKEYEPITAYVGLPLHMSGESSESALKAQSFGDEIEKRFGIPVRYIDERLSTVSAQRKLRDAGVSARDSKEHVDSMAAVSILELGLQSEK
jgi:putative Holliday junction resolvase